MFKFKRNKYNFQLFNNMETYNNTFYTPLDLNQISKASINNERDLEQEIIKICDICKDICKWFAN